jgi:hypothetical protein
MTYQVETLAGGRVVTAEVDRCFSQHDSTVFFLAQVVTVNDCEQLPRAYAEAV